MLAFFTPDEAFITYINYKALGCGLRRPDLVHETAILDTSDRAASVSQEHRRAYKLLEFWRLPPVLIIHLKRFSYDTNGGWAASREKIEDFITFPVR